MSMLCSLVYAFCSFFKNIFGVGGKLGGVLVLVLVLSSSAGEWTGKIFDMPSPP